MTADLPCPLCNRPGIRMGAYWHIEARRVEIKYHCVDCHHTWHVPAETQPACDEHIAGDAALPGCGIVGTGQGR